MSRDEVPPSSHAADQAWLSMLLVNDPNTALVGSLRPARQRPLWAALLRPFQSPAPLPAPETGWGTKQVPALRSRPTGWVGAGLLLALGVGLAGVRPERVQLAAAEAYATFQSERLASATPPVRPAPAPQLANVAGGSAELSRGAWAAVGALEGAPALTVNTLPPSPEPRAQAREEGSAALPRTAKAAAASASAKKKPAARPLRREFGRALGKPKRSGQSRGS